MKFLKGPFGGGRKRLLAWVGALALGAVATMSPAHAAAPPAGTEIGNQALARYVDSGGTQQESKSNNALTVVQQVGGFTLVSDGTKSAAPGNIVYMPHTLTNTGNGSDKFQLTVADSNLATPAFTKIAIYADANGTGLPTGSPLCASDGSGGAPLCTAGFAQTLAGNGGVFRFVVAYTVPPTASGSWSDKATVTATAATPALYTTPTATNTDTVNLTSGAAFAATKSLSLPGVKAPGGANWPPAITGGPPSTSASCNTTWPTSTDPGCTYAVYTINFTNNGAAPGAFTVKDVIPSGLTYVKGSAVWSGNGGVALAEPATSGPVLYSYDGTNTVLATVSSVGVGQSGTLSFVVLVNSTAKPDGSNTGNTAFYGTTDCANANASSCAVTPTNKVPFNPSTVYGVVAASTASNPVKDAATPPAVTTDQNNLVIMPSVTPNGSVRFNNHVVNTGNGTDTFNVAAINNLPPGSTGPFPPGTRFDFFKSDGLTPLLDTNNDGIVDTGPLDPGANVVIVLKAILPPDAPTSPDGSTVNVLMTATSVGSAGQTSDSVWDQTKIGPSTLVDLTNTASGNGTLGTVGNGDVGPGPSPSPTTVMTTTPGVGAAFNLFIKNNDSKDNSYNLAASSSSTFPGTLPSGWTVAYYPSGTSCVPATPTTPMPSPVTQPLAVTAGAQVQVVACVTPAANAATNVVQPIYFQVKSTTNASTGMLVSDTKQDAVTVNAAAVKKLLLTSNQTGQVTIPGSVAYLHTLSNTGTQSCGIGTGNPTGFTVSVSMPPADVAAGWSYSLALIDDVAGTSTPITNGTIPGLAAGKQEKIRLTVIAPAGVAEGFVNNATLTVVDNTADACGTVSNVDSTTAQSAKQLVVVKTQSADLSCTGNTNSFATTTLVQKPGTCVIYKIVATNNASTPMTNVSINDMVPAYTSWATNQPSNQCTGTGTTGTLALNHAAGTTGVICGTADTLAPGGTVTLLFAVQLNPLP